MKNHTIAALAFSAATGLAASSAHATTFANYDPVSTAYNMHLVGTDLFSATEAVEFKYTTPLLSTLGNLSAALTFDATETGAISFGPLVLATFDGEFTINYTGSTSIPIGSTVLNPGDVLLSGDFLGSVFTGYGSSGSLIDSVLGGGLVSFDDNKFLTFDPTTDQAFTIGMTSVTPPPSVVGGFLTDFNAVSDGQFAADITHEGGFVPEPATWALMLVGVGAVGFSLRSRSKPAKAAA